MYADFVLPATNYSSACFLPVRCAARFGRVRRGHRRFESLAARQQVCHVAAAFARASRWPGSWIRRCHRASCRVPACHPRRIPSASNRPTRRARRAWSASFPALPRGSRENAGRRHRASDRPTSLAERDEAFTIEWLIRRRRPIGDFQQRWIEIDVDRRHVRTTARFDRSRPAHDEGDARAPFVQAPLAAAQRRLSVMSPARPMPSLA